MGLLRLELEVYLWQKKWFLTMVVGLFLAYVTNSDVLLQAEQQNIIINGWDVLFSTFGNSNVLFFVLNTTFLFLISNLTNESDINQTVLLRSGSRQIWWNTKVFTLLIAALWYGGILVGIITAVSSFVLTWPNHWSQGATQYPHLYYLNPAIQTSPPLIAFLHLFFLLNITWFCLGLVAIIATLQFRSSALGFLVGIALNFVGLWAFRAEISSIFLFHFHMLYNYHAFDNTTSFYPTIFSSLIYWAIWVTVSIIIGTVLVRKRDFFCQESPL